MKSGAKKWTVAILELALFLVVTVVYQKIVHDKFVFEDLVGAIAILGFLRASVASQR